MGSATKPKGEAKAILIAGVFPITDGYPNIKNRIEYLKNCDKYVVTEIFCSQPEWKNKPASSNIIRFVFSYLKFTLLIIKNIKLVNNSVIYIPYPSIISCLIVRLFSVKGVILIDAFISIYDTLFIDRKLTGKRISKPVYLLEKLSFISADLILVDTEFNSKYYANIFNIDINKFYYSPLFTPEIKSSRPTFRNLRRNRKIENKFTVLFIGNMIPLHGIETISKSLKYLIKIKNLNIKIIGDGQESYRLENNFLINNKSIDWNREWQSYKSLQQFIESSDLCLGIFSKNQKAQRVCPYKIYLYSFYGKAILTAKTKWSNSVKPSPFYLIPSGNPRALANAIIMARKSCLNISDLERKSKYFYENNLSNKICGNIFNKIIQTALLQIKNS